MHKKIVTISNIMGHHILNKDSNFQIRVLVTVLQAIHLKRKYHSRNIIQVKGETGIRISIKKVYMT